MNQQTRNVVFGCLLHDIGKPVFRSGQLEGTHSKAGYDFLKSIDAYKDRTEILNCVRYHHASEIRASKPEETDICYIAYIADNIAAAADRREADTEGGYERYLPLSPVFTHLNGEHSGSSMQFAFQDGKLRMPVRTENQKLTAGNYSEVVNTLKKELSALPPADEWMNSLLSVMEGSTSAIPSSTNTKESPDVSLYDHLKVTAAVGACISEWFLNAGRSDFKKALFDNEKEFRKQNVFLLYSADFSGIQKFIYTVSTKNAIKSLRSRSFFLEIAMEHYIDELLDSCGVGRANLLYSGGGHCYILLPNTDEVREKVEAWNLRFNDWLLEEFGNSLYLADGYTCCSADDLTNTPAEEMPYREMFRRVSNEIAKKKNHRYSAEQILRLNRKLKDSEGRECRICGKTEKLQKTEDGYICSRCAMFEKLSSAIQENNIYIVSDAAAPFCAFSLPGTEGERFYTLSGIEEARKSIAAGTSVRRIYTKNRLYAGLNYSTRIYVGDYAKSNMLQELADSSEGVSKLGVCRMDVDNLGQAFVSGFEKSGVSATDAKRFVTISRTAAFSRQLSTFFKCYINPILSGEFENRRPLNVSVVYSGGDDVFLIGSWTDALEAAERIREAFSAFSCEALTISAGVAVVDSHYPARAAAQIAADMEDESKSLNGKNGITLFEPGQTHCYHWSEYLEKVKGEKKKLLSDFFRSGDNERGNAFLYKLTELLREAQKAKGKGIELARYAYILARLKPTDRDAAKKYEAFSDKMYLWSLDAKDRKQLITAIYIYVYETRKRK